MTRLFSIVLLAAASAGCAHLRPIAPKLAATMTETATRVEVVRVLDALHDAASKAQANRYFSLFAPDAVFLGTDASERWTLDQFKAYALPYFARGQGWTYTPVERHTGVSQDGWAWFDELLENQKYGLCRGSGTLRQQSNGAWLIVQYDLSVPIPNDLLPHVAEEIRAAKRPAPAGEAK
jgi:hypothetical protein